MNQINIAVYHKLGPEEALIRAKGLLEKVKSQFSDKIKNINEVWNGPTATFDISISVEIFIITINAEISGGLVVKDNYVQVYSTRMSENISEYQTKIETTITNELTKLLK